MLFHGRVQPRKLCEWRKEGRTRCSDQPAVPSFSG
jgi:hypothetical protein